MMSEGRRTDLLRTNRARQPKEGKEELPCPCGRDDVVCASGTIGELRRLDARGVAHRRQGEYRGPARLARLGLDAGDEGLQAGHDRPLRRETPCGETPLLVFVKRAHARVRDVGEES
jgi:hypothetical protein